MMILKLILNRKEVSKLSPDGKSSPAARISVPKVLLQDFKVIACAPERVPE